jgi:hypothetical protein
MLVMTKQGQGIAPKNYRRYVPVYAGMAGFFQDRFHVEGVLIFRIVFTSRVFFRIVFTSREDVFDRRRRVLCVCVVGVCLYSAVGAWE